MSDNDQERDIFLFIFLVFATNSLPFTQFYCASATRRGPTLLQHCWSGTEDDLSALRNLSCSTGVEALGNVVSLSGAATSNSSNDAIITEIQGYYCMAFRYYETEEAEDGSEIKTLAATYTCDLDRACEGRTMLIGHKYHYRGQNGDLFCCDHENNCNTHGLIRSPMEQRTCYNANRDNTASSVEIKVCQQLDTPCMRNITKRVKDSTYSMEVVKEEHLCDNYRVCAKHNLTGLRGNACIDILNNATSAETELCCCETNNCLAPPWLNDPSPHSTSDPPDQNYWQKTVLISILVAISFLGIFLSFCFVSRMLKRRKLARENSGVQFTRQSYTSVSADGGENAADDVHILQS